MIGRSMTRPLIVVPVATIRSRTNSTGLPSVLGPSPEMSITRRMPLNLFFSIEVAAKASASPTALPPGQNISGCARIFLPKASALALS